MLIDHAECTSINRFLGSTAGEELVNCVSEGMPDDFIRFKIDQSQRPFRFRRNRKAEKTKTTESAHHSVAGKD